MPQVSQAKPESLAEGAKAESIPQGGADFERTERGRLSAITFGAFGIAGSRKKKKKKPTLAASMSAPRLNAHHMKNSMNKDARPGTKSPRISELEVIVREQQEIIIGLKDYVRRAQLNGTPVDTATGSGSSKPHSLLSHSIQSGAAVDWDERNNINVLDTTADRLRRKVSKVKRDAKSKILEERMRSKRLEKELSASMQRAEHLQNEVYLKAEIVEGHKDELKMAMHKIKQINNQVSLVTMERDMLRKSVASLKKALANHV